MPFHIRCQKCGHEFDVDKWVPGLECPRCKAADTVPITKVVSGPSAAEPSESVRERGKVLDWKRNTNVGIVAGIIIVAIWSGILWWKFGPGKKHDVWIYAMCTKCNECFEAVSDELPGRCPKCGSSGTVYQAYKCNGKMERGKFVPCDHIFPYIPPPSMKPLESESLENLSEEERAKRMEEYYLNEEKYYEKLEAARRCPKCGSDNTQLYYTEEQEKKL